MGLQGKGDLGPRRGLEVALCHAVENGGPWRHSRHLSFRELGPAQEAVVCGPALPPGMLELSALPLGSLELSGWRCGLCFARLTP